MRLYSSLKLCYEPRITYVSHRDNVFSDILNNNYWSTVQISDYYCTFLSLPAQDPLRIFICYGGLTKMCPEATWQSFPFFPPQILAIVPNHLVINNYQVEWDTHQMVQSRRA